MAEAIILGAVAGEVLRKIIECIEKAVNFREDLERLRDTLVGVLEVIEKVKKMDLKPDARMRKSVEKLQRRLAGGKELVDRCSKVNSWNIPLRVFLSSQITKLDEAILSFFQRELQVDIWHDNKQILGVNYEILNKVEQLGRDMNALQIGQTNSSKGFDSGLCAVPDPPVHRVVGFDLALRELKTKLFKDDLSVLGLCAPGGCGKSTLAAMLCRDKEVGGKFGGEIFFLTVSTISVLDILQRIFAKISSVAPKPREEDAIKQFHHILKERGSKPLLLVLDDVREGSIIENFFFRTEGYKLLVTSREAFNVYDSKYHSKYTLKTLETPDSMALFKQIAVSEYKYSVPDEELQEEIVGCCYGFPLAITVIAKSLSLEPPVQWRIMAKNLSEGASILDFSEKLRKCLSWSLESLDDIFRKCFLDLGSFPEGKRIPASVLLDIWCELHGLQDEDVAFTILLALESRNLLKLVGSRKIAMETDVYTELFVTQHDLLRELAIYESQQQQSKRLVYLSTGEMRPESLSEVEVMILNSPTTNYELPPFMEEMRNLKDLIIVNRGQTHAELSRFMRIHGLVNLKRIRLEKVLVPSLHEFTVPFTNLQKISLVMCDFGQALVKCSVNAYQVLPNLVEINIDYCHRLVELPSWICDIISLERLIITNCDSLSALPERIGCIAELESLRLHGCTALRKLPDSIKELRKLRFLYISDCCSLEELPSVLGELRCLRKLDMRGCIRLRKVPHSVMNLVHLKEVVCDEDKARLWERLSVSSSPPKITVLKKDNNLDWLQLD